MGRRREPRVRLDIPVKVCGMDSSGHPFVQTAYAISISRTGVRLTGVGPLVRLGETVVVIYKQRKARFRVKWIGEAGQTEFGQAGLEAADPKGLIWDFALPHPGADGYLPARHVSPNNTSLEKEKNASNAAPSSGTQTESGSGIERRSAERFKCRGSAEIFVPSVSFPTRGQIDDVSLSGVYIQTSAPLPVGNDVKLNLAIQGFLVQAEGQVRTSHPGVGMGLVFTSVTPENRQVLGTVLNRLAGSAVPPRSRAATAYSTQSVAPACGPASAVPPVWDIVGREISDWFRTHEMLRREDFHAIVRRLQSTLS